MVVAINRIVEHHCLNFYFHNNIITCNVHISFGYMHFQN